jgi:ketosteroid isomerase-like protein
MSEPLALVSRYLAVVESLPADPGPLTGLLHPDFEQTEYPNALNPRGQRSDRADCLRRLGQARAILASQRYLVRGAIEGPSGLAVEATWEGTMAVDAGPLKAGQVVRAQFCMVFELRDGKVFRQRNYDCFEPWK